MFTDIRNKIANNEYVNKIPYTQESRVMYREESSKLKKEFLNSKDVFIKGGASEAQSTKAAEYVWSEGHSSGYSEVLNYAYDLYDILAAK